jgi:hypothetical protein
MPLEFFLGLKKESCKVFNKIGKKQQTNPLELRIMINEKSLYNYTKNKRYNCNQNR